MMIPIEKPRTNPPITAFDRKFDTQPMRATPSARYTTPVASASAAANFAASSVPNAAVPTRGVMTAATTAATAALGPWTICFDVPNSA